MNTAVNPFFFLKPSLTNIFQFADLKRDFSVCSANDKLLRNSDIFEGHDKKEKLDKIITKTLIMFTIISIIFLFLIQNSPYHIIEHSKPRFKGK